MSFQKIFQLHYMAFRDRVLTTGPPGKSWDWLLKRVCKNDNMHSWDMFISELQLQD